MSLSRHFVSALSDYFIGVNCFSEEILLIKFNTRFTYSHVLRRSSHFSWYIRLRSL